MNEQPKPKQTLWHRCRDTLTLRDDLVTLLIFLGLAGAAIGWVKVSQLSQDNKERIADIQASRKADRKLVYCGIDRLASAFTAFTTGSVKQTQEEAVAIDKALKGDSGLSAAHRAFLLEWVDTVAAVEESVPAIANLHPFVFKDLPCASRSHV